MKFRAHSTTVFQLALLSVITIGCTSTNKVVAPTPLPPPRLAIWTPTAIPTATSPVWNSTHVIAQKSYVHVITFSPDSQYLAMQDQDGLTTVFDVTNKVLLWQKILLRLGRIGSLFFTSDGQSLVVVQDSALMLTSAIRILRTVDGTEIASIERNHAIHSLAMSAEGTYLASIGDGFGQVWSLDTQQERARFGVPEGASAMAFDPSGHYLLTGSGNGDLQVWEWSNGQELKRINIGGPVRKLVVSPNGQFLAVLGFHDGVIRIIDLRSLAQVATLSMNENAMAFSPDSQYLATGGLDRILRLWSVETWQEQRQISQNGIVEDLTFDPQGYYVLSETRSNAAQLWEVATGGEVGLFPERQLFSVAISPDSRYIATGGNGTVHLWELDAVEQPSGQPVALGIVTPQFTLTPNPAEIPTTVILVSARSDYSAGVYRPIIQSLVVTYDPAQWEYYFPEQYRVPVMRHLNIPGCLLTRNVGRGLGGGLVMEHQSVAVKDELYRDLLIREASSGKINAVLYRTPVEALSLGLVHVAVEEESKCMSDAEALLLTYEILTRAIEP